MGLIFPASTAAWQASSESKTRAGPVWWMRSWPATLMTAAVGGEVAAHDDEAAGGLERLVPGVDDGLAGGFDGERGLFGEGLAGDGDAVAFEQACVEEALGEEAAAACVLIVLGDVLAAGGEVADEGRALGDAVEVVHGEGDVELAARWR